MAVAAALVVAVSGLAVSIPAEPSRAATATAAFPSGDTITLAYATSFGENTVSVIDTLTNSEIATIPVGAGPETVAVNPAGTRVYVPNQTSGTVSVIDTATNSVVATIPVGSQPFGVAMTPDGSRAYVTNRASNSVSVIDAGTNTVTATIAVGVGPLGLAVTPDGTRAFVANELSNSASVIDTATDTAVDTIGLGTRPSFVAFTPDGARAVVTTTTSGNLYVVDTATNTVAGFIPVGSGPRGVVVSLDGATAYVANTGDNSVTAIDLASSTVTTTIPVGSVPAVVALAPDGTRLYVTNSGSDNLSVVDTATNVVLATIPVGFNIAGVGVADIPTAGRMSVFYAVPSTDGSTVTIAGLVQDAPNTPYDIAVNSSSSCAAGGAPAGVPDISVTTNSEGYAYFANTFPVGPGVQGNLHLISASPLNRSNCYPIGADNTAWENAASIPLVGGAGSTQGTIALPGESRWFKFQAAPDTRVTVTLSGLSDDYAVAVYNDIGDVSSDVPTSTHDLNRLSAEAPGTAFTPSAFIPSAFIPSAFIPSAFIPSAFIPSAFIPSAFIPSAFIPSAFIPSSYSPSALLPGGFTPSAFVPGAFDPSEYSPAATIPPPFSAATVLPSAFNPLTYSSAISRSLISYNDEGGLAAKTATVNTWQSTGSFYIQVSGHNGAHDPVSGFQLSVNGGSSSCAPSVVPIGSPPVSVPAGGRRAVILTDSSRLNGAPAAIADVMTQLQTVASRPEVAGTVVDLAGNARVQALNAQADSNPGCPYAKNLAAGAIKDVVDSYRANNPLDYVVIAGPDDVIPFFRHPDETLIGNETGYVPPVADATPSQAALRLSYTLTDNDYGSQITLVSQSDAFPLPDLAVGRLVETASEISGMVQAYLATSGGVLPTPTSSLVTGYDFLTYPAQSVESDLAAGIGRLPDTLIAPREEAPAESWTAAELKNAFLNSGRHDIVFLAGHFSANDTLAADYTTDMITTDMEQSAVNLYNSLVFSPGCHSGYNIVAGDAVPDVTLTLDWPEAFARKQATLIGGTGYQYGDTDFIAYSEQIYASFAHMLRYGTGPVSVGQTLLRSKQDYLANTVDLDAIGRKAVYEATLYGLPMVSINLPAGRIPAPTDSSIVAPPTPVGTDPGATLGLTSSDVTLLPTLSENTLTVNDLTNGNTPVSASYLSGQDGVSAQPYRPVLPVLSENVSVPGQSLRGALFLGGSYTDTPGVTPLTGAPATEIRGVHTGFQSSVFFPPKPWSINYFDALDGSGTGATRLLVTPAQHRSEPSPASTNTRRQYSTMDFRLFYSNNTASYGSGALTSTPALAAAPQILNVQSQPGVTPGTVEFCATVGDDPAAGVQAAYVTYTDPTAAAPAWRSLALSQGGCSTEVSWSNLTASDSTSWGGQLDQVGLGGAAAASLRFFVQAASGTGLVSMADNLGAGYSLPSESTTGGFSIVRNVTGALPSASFGTPMTVRAEVNRFFPDAPPGATIGPPIGDLPVTFAIGNQSATAVTDSNGVAEANIPLQVPPGTYAVSAAVSPAGGLVPSSAEAAQPIAVSEAPTLLTLAPTGGSGVEGLTSYTATLCAAEGAATCGPEDAPVADRTIVFVLSGPVARTVARATNAAGQAQFNAYGLPAGSYRLQAYFEGAVPGVGTLADPFYAPPAVNPVTATFSSTATYTVPPTLSLPANIAMPPTGPNGAVVSYVVSATDPIDPRPAVSCSPASTTFFPIGTTTVNCTATNTAGLSSTGSFTVSVGSRQLAPGTTTCNGTYSGRGTNVVVPAGATCVLLAGTTVSGNITVQGGGSLRATGVSVGKSVTLRGAGPSLLCGLSVGQNLSISDAPPGTVATVVGDTTQGCDAGATIRGNVTITNNGAPVVLGSSRVGTTIGARGSGHVKASGNTALLTLTDDWIGTSLDVTGPGPVIIRNCTVAGKPVG